MRDFYSVLHVKPKASDAEIKAAFYNIAKTCHPDLKPGDKEAEAVFQEAKRAYTFLRNLETRKMYDTFLAEQRAARWERRRQSVMTMSAAFVITTTAVAFVSMMWLNVGGLPFAGGRLAGAAERHDVELAAERSAVELAHAPAQAAESRTEADSTQHVSEWPADGP